MSLAEEGGSGAATSPRIRTVGSGRAALAGTVALGYVYVGRLRAELAVLLAMLGVLGFLSWTRWILEPWGLSVLLVALVGLAVLRIAHPAWLAWRVPQVADRPYNRWWFYLLWLLVWSIALELVLMRRAEVFGYETFRIPAANMAPALQPGDYVLTDAWRYADSDPSVGDVVVYQRPEWGEGAARFISRIVAVPGDVVEYRDGRLRRNGVQEIRDTALERNLARPVGPLTLGPGQFFLIGDDRYRSLDSRHFGPVARDRIHGRVETVWFRPTDPLGYPVRIHRAD